MYLGVNIEFLIKIFFDISLSIADIEEITPEWVYFMFRVSNMV